MHVYKKVSSTDVSKETDLVLTLIEGVNGPCAFITDPAQARDTIPIPIEDALSSARHMIAGDVNPRNLVVVDEENLWDERWGRLMPYRDAVR
jgi:hypothetical protein